MSNKTKIGQANAKTLTAMKLAVVSFAAVFLAPAQSAAQGFETDFGSAERLNLVSELAVLTVRIPTTACNIDTGFAADDNRKLIEGTLQEFDTIVTVLRNGDPERGVIGEETRPQTFRAIEAVRSGLEDLKVHAGAESSDRGELLSSADSLYEAVDALSIQISAQYSNPTALLRSDAILLDVAGRQRVQLGRVAEATCMVLADTADVEAVDNLESSMALFSRTLDGLSNGIPNLGLPPPPNADIKAALANASTQWNSLKSNLERILDADAPDTEERETILAGLGDLERLLGEIALMYVSSSKLN
jgi:hypothetical protein